MSEFLAKATGTEKALGVRASQYYRPINAHVKENIANEVISSYMMRETIRAVVREEIKKLFPTTAQPQVSSFADVIREVQQALGSSTTPEPLSEPQAMAYAAAIRRPSPK